MFRNRGALQVITANWLLIVATAVVAVLMIRDIYVHDVMDR
jgi:hypothetical protein